MPIDTTAPQIPATDSPETSTPSPENLNNGSPEVPTVKKHNRLASLAFAILLALAIGAFLFIRIRQTPVLGPEMHTFFEYSETDLGTLEQLEPSGDIATSQAHEWQETAYTLVEEHDTLDVDAAMIYAYLSVAQLDTTMLAHELHGEFKGSLDTVSKRVMCEFYIDSCAGLQSNDNAYDTKLADIVMAKISQRINNDAKVKKNYPLQPGEQYWQGPEPQIGLSSGSLTPWLSRSNSLFKPPAPHEPESKELTAQLAEVKTRLSKATNEEKANVVKWAGGPGTKTPPGIWLTLADDYMLDQNLPIERYLQIKALTSMAMADAVAAVFDAKYTYQYKRPNMFDQSIKTIMPTPNHPSYPAGHSTISWAAATTLSHYLPEHGQEWERLAVEASISRVIGGIHFPMDDEAGTTLGKKLGQEVINNW